MRCPHCHKDILRRQRIGNQCALCGQHFALEPKTNPLNLHDLRVRKLADRLSGDGQWRYTVTQLWYAASRRRLWRSGGGGGEAGGCLGCLMWLCVIAFVVVLWVSNEVGTADPASTAAALGVTAGAAALFGFLRSRVRDRGRVRKRFTIRMPLTLERFRGLVPGRWLQVYDKPPQGMVDETMAPMLTVRHPRVALLCEDQSVRACLSANRAPQTHAMAMVRTVDEVPADVPVVVLHDASPRGIEFAAEAREALGERALLAGLRPRAVMPPKTHLRLRGRELPRAEAAALGTRAATLGLTEEETAWLAAGWFAPVAALPPGRLLAGVERALRRAAERGDPDQRAAHRVGFLTWPEPEAWRA